MSRCVKNIYSGVMIPDSHAVKNILDKSLSDSDIIKQIEALIAKATTAVNTVEYNKIVVTAILVITIIVLFLVATHI